MNNTLTFPKEMSSLLAEEIGLHLGDGTMNFYNKRGFYQLRGHIKDDKEHYISRIFNIYQELFGIEVKLREMPSTGVYGFQIWSNRLVKFKSEMIGLPLGKKDDFSILSEIIGNLKFSISFLRGYFDTDGCLYLEKKNEKLYPRVEMASISEKFTLELREILTRLGYNPSYYKEKRQQKGWHDLYRIIIRGDEMVEKWFSEIRPANPKHIRKFNKLKNMAPPRFELGTSR